MAYIWMALRNSRAMPSMIPPYGCGVEWSTRKVSVSQHSAARHTEAKWMVGWAADAWING